MEYCISTDIIRGEIVTDGIDRLEQSVTDIKESITDMKKDVSKLYEKVEKINTDLVELNTTLKVKESITDKFKQDIKDNTNKRLMIWGLILSVIVVVQVAWYYIVGGSL